MVELSVVLVWCSAVPEGEDGEEDAAVVSEELVSFVLSSDPLLS